jgi:small-conductance mechanosensitive channel
VVKVDGFEGRISDIKTRYTVIRAVNGRESIVPNELLITQRVENSSLADTRVAQTTTVSVGYDTELERLFVLLAAAVAAVPRVQSDPGPSLQLSNFGADGLELTLVYWIADPENGTGNVRSEVNLAVLALLRREQVTIPYPQRVVHQA